MDRARDPEKYRRRARERYRRQRSVILEQVKAYQERNRDDVNERKRSRYRSQEPQARRESALRRLYGMSVADRLVMSTEQDDRCAICRRIPAKPLEVDHDHKTGVIRGLLCDRCNKGIGQFGDDPKILEAAIAYLTAGGKK